MHDFIRTNSQLIILLPVFFLLFVFFWNFNIGSSFSNKLFPAATLQAEFLGCFAKNTIPDILNCFDAHSETWLSEFGQEAVINQFSKYESQFGANFVCHLAGHVIGEAIYDNSSTHSEAFGHISHACFSSILHGVVGKIVVSEGADALLAINPEQICSNISNEEGSYSLCLHGFGHAYELSNNYETLSALKLCDEKVGSDHLIYCAGGVFMELFGATLGRGHVLVSPEKYEKEGDLFYPCTLEEIESRETFAKACYNQKSGTVYRESQRLGIPHLKLCEQVTAEYRYSCVRGAGASRANVNTGTFDHILTVCRDTDSPDDRNTCLLGAFRYMTLGEDKSTPEKFCETLTKDESVVCEFE